MDKLRGSVWSISNGEIDLEVQALGAMLGPVRVRLGDRDIFPFALAPWATEAASSELPPILQRLRGEWPCVPFGVTHPISSFPPSWRPENCTLDAAIDNSHPHGYGSNHHWHCERIEADAIELAIEYPQDAPIRRLCRRISLPAGQTRIDFELLVEARTTCSLPIGLHPTFSLSTHCGQTDIIPGAYLFGRTYPLQFEASSQLKVDLEFHDLTQVLQTDGSYVDLSRLPLNALREELVQLYGVDGRFTLINHESGYSAQLCWNPEDFPSCILWISNRGRDAYPWASRHLAIGIEPTCSFFDLNPSVAANPSSPMAGQGVKMLAEFSAEQTWTSAYSVALAATR